MRTGMTDVDMCDIVATPSRCTHVAHVHMCTCLRSLPSDEDFAVLLAFGDIGQASLQGCNAPLSSSHCTSTITANCLS